MAAFSRHESALEWGRRKAEESWGPAALVSPPYAFVETDYYCSTMGEDLKKQFLAFEKLADPASLIEYKHQTNAWELEFTAESNLPEPRPLNLDPGYISRAKLVLASTKDHAHRIYLGRGIYAEITLHYRHRRWQAQSWTYPDYRREDYHAFFNTCRDYLRSRL